ncbi:MAG: hypothetical protein HOO96_07360 [Polyangiaceae bacterium]|nr:hypothetical protein [Polyangiaceae bacterium]
MPVALAAYLGCGGGAKDRTPAVSPPLAVSPGSAPVASVTGSTDVPATPVRPSGPDQFHVWLRSDDELYVLPGEGALVYGPNGAAIVTDDAIKVVSRSPLGAYFHKAWMPLSIMRLQVDAVMGSWPDAAYVGKSLMNADCRCGCPGFLDYWSKSHWEPASVRPADATSWRDKMGWGIPHNALNRASLGSTHFVAAAPLGLPRVVVAAQPTCPSGAAENGGRSDTNRAQLLVLREGVVEADRPKMTLARPGEKGSPTKMASIGRVVTSESGEIVVLGAQEGGLVAVEYWSSVTATSKLWTLPKHPKGGGLNYDVFIGIVPSLAMRTKADMWVGGSREGRAYLAHYDGARWTVLDAPPMTAAVGSMGGPPQGRLYLTTVTGELWANDGGLAWTQVKVPEDAKVFQVRAVARNDTRDIWLAGGRVVLRSRAPKAPAVTLTQGPRAHASTDPPRPEQALPGPSDTCAGIFVPLFAVSENASDSYAFPLMQSALRGHGELAKLELGVTDDGRFGAIAPDYALAKAFATFAKAKVKGASPRILCETVSMRPVPFTFDP